jgi:hypothetical protein
MARSRDLEIPDSSVLSPGAKVAGLKGEVCMIEVVANVLSHLFEVVKIFLGPTFGNEYFGRRIGLVFGVNVIGLHNVWGFKRFIKLLHYFFMQI